MQRGSIAPHVWPRFNTYMINGWWWNEWINEWKSEWWLTNLYLKTIMQTWSCLAVLRYWTCRWGSGRSLSSRKRGWRWYFTGSSKGEWTSQSCVNQVPPPVQPAGVFHFPTAPTRLWVPSGAVRGPNHLQLTEPPPEDPDLLPSSARREGENGCRLKSSSVLSCMPLSGHKHSFSCFIFSRFSQMWSCQLDIKRSVLSSGHVWDFLTISMRLVNTVVTFFFSPAKFNCTSTKWQSQKVQFNPDCS